MGSRIIVCGSVGLSAAAYAKAQDIPLLEVFVMDPNDPDGASFVPKGMKAEDIFSTNGGEDDEYRAWSKNTYDPVEERWLFGCSLHDDDWWNAKHDLLPSSLANLKDRPNLDVILAYEEWSKKLESAWKIDLASWSAVDPIPKLPDGLGSLIADGVYEEALGEIRRLLAQGA
jgi:hypothetical protein